MATTGDRSVRIQALAARQRWVVGHEQLLGLGLTRSWIRHAVTSGRLHPRWPGVYAVGRAELSREGDWIAAVLTCAPGALLSHLSAAVLWQMCPVEADRIEVTVAAPRRPRRDGITVHRRERMRPDEVALRRGIPVTNPVRTLVDLAARFDREPLEAAVNSAVGAGLTRPERLRAALDDHARQPGVRALGRLLDAHTFRLTDSRLERLFIPVAIRAGLPRPLYPGARQRLPRRLLLAGPGAGRRDRRQRLSPHGRPGDQGPAARQRTHGSRSHAASLHARAGGARPGPRRASPRA